MKKLLVVTLLSLLALPLNSFAEEPQAFEIVIKDHKFEPAETKVPANKKVKLVIKNTDSTAEEFESHDLKREKIVKGNSEISVAVGPLKPGTYNYVGEFNEATAKGSIIAE